MMNKGMRSIIKTESQPILIPAGTAGGTQIQFPDNQYIRNKKLMAIVLTPSFFPLTGVPHFYVDGKVISSVDILQNIYLTLESYSGVQYLRKKPIVELMPYNAIGGVGNIATQENFIGQKTNFPKCYIELANGIAPIANDQYVLFDIHFTELTVEKLKTELGTEFKNKK